MADDRVRVYARIRPRGTSREEFGDAAVRCLGENGVAVDDLEGAVNDSLRNSVQGGVAQAAAATRKFEFDGSFGGSSTQADVFSDVGAPVVRAVLQGYHGCVFAYGQTGSGKTFSLLNAGTAQKNFEDAGLLPRFVATLYVRAGQDAAHQYAVECGAFQVYNEQVADLLHPEHRNGKGQNLSVSKKDGHGQVDNLTWKACASAKELLDHFAYARKNVIYAETKMNKASSRSHACFQLRVTRREKNSTKGSVSLCSCGRFSRFRTSEKEWSRRQGVEGGDQHQRFIIGPGQCSGCISGEEEARALPGLETDESVRGFGRRELPHDLTLLRFSRGRFDLRDVVGVKLRATSDALRVQGCGQCRRGG